MSKPTTLVQAERQKKEKNLSQLSLLELICRAQREDLSLPKGEGSERAIFLYAYGDPISAAQAYEKALITREDACVRGFCIARIERESLEILLRDIANERGACVADHSLRQFWRHFKRVYRDNQVAQKEFVAFFTKNVDHKIQPEMLAHFRMCVAADAAKSKPIAPPH